MNLFPPLLQKGDLIYITSPAKAIDVAYIQEAKVFLEKHGFQVLLADHVQEAYHYFSGTEEERRRDFQFGIDHPDVKAIWCARGGYGSIRIVDQIQWAAQLRAPKWIVGFSDITVFHQKMQRYHVPSIHGTMPLNISSNTEASLATLLQALTEKSYSITAKSQLHNKCGEASGPIVGGNLSILFSLLGTDDRMDFQHKILFIEDLSEQLYHIDRMLHSFKKAGVFDQISGLIIGGMTDLKDTQPATGFVLEELILSHFQYRNIPIAFDFPVGHIDDNQAIRIGDQAQLKVGENEVSLKIGVN